VSNLLLLRGCEPGLREIRLSDWYHLQQDVSEGLSQLHVFSMKKKAKAGEVQFQITVREYATPPPGQHVRFFAEADKQVNQKTLPIVPSGWGNSVFTALADCLRMIRQFPYEGEE
jgi:hypothetical protein